MNRLPSLPPTPALTAVPKRAHRALHDLGRLLAGLSLVAALSCDDPLEGPPSDRVVGYIGFSLVRGHEPQVPETATANIPLDVTVWTMGDGCVEGGDTEVAVDGLRAEVTPYDFVDWSAAACTLELRLFEHAATLVFEDPGIAEVVLRYSTRYHDRIPDGRKVYAVEVSPAG